MGTYRQPGNDEEKKEGSSAVDLGQLISTGMNVYSSMSKQYSDRADIKRAAAALQKVKNPPVTQKDVTYGEEKPSTELPTFTVNYSKADENMGLKDGITTHRPTGKMIEDKIESQKS
jgi:hypothetical protein